MVNGLRSFLDFKEEVIVLSKGDLLDTEMQEFLLSELQKKYPKKQIFLISSATGEGVEVLKDFLIDNYSIEKEDIFPELDDSNITKVYDLTQNTDPKRVEITYEGDLMFKASGERLEEIVRMTDFDNMEAVMRFYNVLDKMMVIRDIEKQLAIVLKEESIDNSFFFEGNEEKNITSRVEIARR